MRQLLPALILILFSGCARTISRLANNAKQPKIETEESINKWLKKTGLTDYEVLTVAPESFFDAMVFYQKRTLLFNKSGKVAELGANQTGVVCHFKTPGEIQNLKPGFPDFTDFLISTHRTYKSKEELRKGHYEDYTDSTYYNLDSLNQYVYTLKGTKTKVEVSSASDYIVVIPFAKYMGRTIQTTDIKKYIRAVKANNYSTFRVILLNLDKQQWWGEKWNNAIRLSTTP